MPRQVPRKERRGPSGPPRGLHVHDRRATRPRPPPRVPLPATGSGTCDENDNPPRADRAPCDSVRAERSRSPVEPGPPAAGAARVFRDSVGPAVRPTAQGSPRRTHTLTLSSPQRTVQTPESTLYTRPDSSVECPRTCWLHHALLASHVVRCKMHVNIMSTLSTGLSAGDTRAASLMAPVASARR